MIKRKGLHCQPVILIDNSPLGQRLKTQVIGSVVTKITYHRLHHLDTLGLHVHRDSTAFLMQRHSGKQTRETETVVAVHMGDEYMAKAREFQPHPLHHHLRPFAAIYHEELVAEIDYLR